MQAPQDAGVWDDDEGAWRTEGNGYLGERVAIELQNARWAGTVLLSVMLLFCGALVAVLLLLSFPLACSLLRCFWVLLLLRLLLLCFRCSLARCCCARGPLS